MPIFKLIEQTVASVANGYTSAVREEIELITVDAWEALLTRYLSGPAILNLKAMAVSIARNHCCLWLRRHLANRLRWRQWSEVDDVAEAEQTSDPDEQDVTRLRRAVASLSQQQREVIDGILGGLTYAEVASILGCTPGNVGYLYRRGMVALRSAWMGNTTVKT